jgi:sugar phosphate isomerase/epimerase
MENFNPKNINLPEKRFKIATTSFIFPDHIIPNVKKLGSFFDEIELLIFESQPKEVLPSKHEIKELLYLSGKLNLTYNIHLPIDVSLTSGSLKKRGQAVDTILQVMERFSPLNPSTHTLHLDMPSDINFKKKTDYSAGIKKWQENIFKNLETLLCKVANPGTISIETLDYPFVFVEMFIKQFNMSVCIDAGHQIKYGYNLLETFDKHKDKTSIIHLHGVDFSQSKIKDHTSLDKLPEQHINQIKTILNDYTGVVSLEVFNLENLTRSLISLSNFLS